MTLLNFSPFHLFVILLSGLFLISCEDSERYIEIKGNVLDEHTKVAIPDRKIIVQSLSEINEKLIPVYAGEFFTDHSGHFIYHLRKDRNIFFYNFSVVGDSAYSFSNSRLGLTELKKHGKFLSFSVNKLVDFTIVLNRNRTTSFQDTLYVSWKSDGMDGRILYPYKIENYGIQNYGKPSDIEFRWIGGEIRSAIKTKVYSDRTTIVKWELFRKGMRNVVTDTILCIRDIPGYAYYKY